MSVSYPLYPSYRDFSDLSWIDVNLYYYIRWMFYYYIRLSLSLPNEINTVVNNYNNEHHWMPELCFFYPISIGRADTGRGHAQRYVRFFKTSFRMEYEYSFTHGFDSISSYVSDNIRYPIRRIDFVINSVRNYTNWESVVTAFEIIYTYGQCNSLIILLPRIGLEPHDLSIDLLRHFEM